MQNLIKSSQRNIIPFTINKNQKLYELKIYSLLVKLSLKTGSAIGDKQIIDEGDKQSDDDKYSVSAVIFDAWQSVFFASFEKIFFIFSKQNLTETRLYLRLLFYWYGFAEGFFTNFLLKRFANIRIQWKRIIEFISYFYKIYFTYCDRFITFSG